MIFKDLQKRRLEILLRMDSELKELEPLFYAEIAEGEYAQFAKVKLEMQKLTNNILSEAMQENGFSKASGVAEIERLK